MLVQIIKSEKDSYWYAECIGEIMEVVDEYEKDYILGEDYDNLNGRRLISKED